MQKIRTSFFLLWFFFYILSLLGLSIQSSYAYSCSLRPSPARGQPIALVIANSQYKDRRLTQIINDAKAMKNALIQLGFRVIFKTELRNSVRDRHNIKHDTFSVKKILDRFKDVKNNLNIIILDASRDNDYPDFYKHRGLASISSPSGFFIAYSTDINKVVRSNSSYNSLYVKELTEIIKTARQKHKRLEDVFMEVTNAIEQKSNESQVPWYNASLKEKFCFGGCKKKPTRKYTWNLKVSSNQNGAKVFIDFRLGGYTPLTVNLPPRKCYTVWVEKNGYTLLDGSKRVCLNRKKKEIYFTLK
jgi:uncharacterized caspase-like protein